MSGSLPTNWLLTGASQEVIDSVELQSPTLSEIARLRKSFTELTGEQISSAYTQASLRARAFARWQLDLASWRLTETGLNQASRPEVIKYRQKLINELGWPTQKIVDLGCALGFDAAGFAAIASQVIAVEIDESTAEYAQWNLKEFGVEVICTDATKFAIPADTDIVFLDPARRKDVASATGEAIRIFDPEEWSPPWSFVEEVAKRHRVLAKVAPGIDTTELANWDIDFVSCAGSLVEAILISGGSGRKRAVLIDQEQIYRYEAKPAPVATGLSRYLIAPNPALIRADALGAISAALVNPHIAWLTSDRPDTPAHLGTTFEVLETTSMNTKELRRLVSRYPASELTIMTRGVELNPEKLRKELFRKPTKGAGELVLALYRNEPANSAVLMRRLRQDPSHNIHQ